MTRFKAIGVAVALGLVAMFTLGGTAAAAPGSQSGALKTFGTGDVSATSNSATIVIDAGEFGGVYVNTKKQTGKLLSDATFAFSSRGDVGGGAPRFSLPIDDGAFDPNTDYAFIDAAGCGATVGDNPSNAVTWVSTQNPACHVNFHGVDYANWTTFASSNPTFRIAKGYIPFIIADAVPAPQTTATYVVTDIFLG